MVPLRSAFERLVEALGDRVTEVELPDGFTLAHGALKSIMAVEQALNYDEFWQRGRERISTALRAHIEWGQTVTALEWHRAVATAMTLRRSLEPWFDRFDAILTPAATGEAPVTREHTGSPVFCTIWSLLGLPAVSLPLLRGPAGLPLGVQLVGRSGEDGRLLRVAAWLEAHRVC